MVVSRHQNSGQNHNLMETNKSLSNVEKFKYLRTTATSQHDIKEESNRLISGNAC
jgi:hypothetical protein